MLFSSTSRRVLCLLCIASAALCLLMLPRWFHDDRSWLVIDADADAPSSSHHHRTSSSPPAAAAGNFRSNAGWSSWFKRAFQQGNDKAVIVEYPEDVERTRQIFKQTFCAGAAAAVPASLQELRIACVGDSITFGNGSHLPDKKPKGGGNYPMTLEAQLLLRKSKRPAGRRSSVSLSVRNFGVNGATAADHTGKFSYRTHKEFEAAVAWKPHVVIIMLGANDCKTTLWRSRGIFKRDLFWLVNSFGLENAASSQLSSKSERRKRRKQQQYSTTSPPAAENESIVAPWILLMTPPPIATTRDTVEWNFDPKRLQKDVIPSIRDVAATLNLGLIELNSVFVSGAWKCPGAGDDDAYYNEHHRRRPRTAAKSRFEECFRDGVHPKRAVHDFIGEYVAKSLCL